MNNLLINPLILTLNNQNQSWIYDEKMHKLKKNISIKNNWIKFIVYVIKSTIADCIFLILRPHWQLLENQLIIGKKIVRYLECS